MDKTWKAVERRIAEFLGGERVPVTGRQRGSAPDIEHELLSIEVKHRNKFPDWLHDAIDQAKKSKKGDQIPVVILHQRHKKVGNCLVVMELQDIMEWMYECGGFKKPDHRGLESDGGGG